MLSDLFFRVRSLFRRKAVETELDDELRFHFEQQVEKYVNSGLTPDEALRRARIDFGGLSQVKEECREARGVQMMETLFQDVRYGLRMLRKSPGFTAVALLTLALGIGANTAIFSVVYGVLLRPLPYQDPSRLIVLNETTPRVGTVSVSYPNFLDWRAQSRTFSKMATVESVAFNLAGPGSGLDQPENISGEAVSSDFLSILGVRPMLGRNFDASQDRAGTAPVILLSYQLWQSHFGGAVGVLGRTVALDGRSFTIVGVLPPDFRWIEKIDLLEPMGAWANENESAMNDRGDRGDLVVLGRLVPGVSFSQAQAEMEGIAARLAQAYPGSNDQFGVTLQPIRDVFVSGLRPAVLVLFAAAAFVLLIACANVANLFLMRGAGRTKEIALRIAVGASRSRIICQILVESLVLAFLGGLLSLALAFAAIRGLARLIPVDMLAGASVNLNGPVLLFAAGLVVLCTFVFGLAPASHSTKPDVQSELRESGRAMSASTGQSRMRAVLAIAEVSLALILLVGAGLMMKSLYRLLSVDPGFRPQRVLTMEMSLRTAQYAKDPARINFWQRVLASVRALPGVQAAALGTDVPLTDNHSRTDITLEGMALPKPGSFPHPDVHRASPGYASTLGIPLQRGREFTEADTETAPQVAMINTTLAQRFFAHEDPIGKRFMFGHPSPKRAPEWVTIVGVAGDTKLYGLANPARLEVYLPFRQSALRDMTLVVKSGLEPAALTSAIRYAIGSIDKEQAIFAIATMQQLVDNSVSTRRITLILLGMFGALALVLGAIGIYGVLAYSVAQRTHEIGIRMALGARGGDVVRMVLAQGAKIAGAGVVIGILASFGLTRLMTKLLFSVSPADPATFAAVAIVLVLVALLASYVPARRTLRVDPMIALRHE
jgi:putative ABC transport system permease protein